MARGGRPNSRPWRLWLCAAAAVLLVANGVRRRVGAEEDTVAHAHRLEQRLPVLLRLEDGQAYMLWPCAASIAGSATAKWTSPSPEMVWWGSMVAARICVVEEDER